MTKNINIVFENFDFIVCDKPSGVLSTPDRFKSDRPCLGLELQTFKKIQIFPVHRLDFEVSGLIIYAKNAKAHKSSQDWFLNKTIQKKYKALTGLQSFSHWPKNLSLKQEAISFNSSQSFVWKTKIIRGKRRSFESPHGDLAETVATMISCQNDIIEWHLSPLTGRAHQLRLELSRHGFPILGDSLYGSQISLEAYSHSQLWPYGGIALRSYEVKFSDQACADYNLPDCIKINA